MKLSTRALRLTPSVTLELDARAKAMARSGRDVVSMAVGQPDFPAPPAVQRAAIERIQSGDVRYTAVAGEPALREAAAGFMQRTRGVVVTPEEVTVCHSAKHALAGALMALVDAGDEVLLPLPAWVSYMEQIKLADGRVVAIPPAAGCRLDVEGLRAKVGPKTRGILINSPSNPTGYVLTEQEVRAVGEVALEHDLWILSDEIYQGLLYDGATNTSPLELGQTVRERTVVVDGASKAWAMTGYRIGFLVAPPAVAAGVAQMHSQMTGSPNAISQAAFTAALAEDLPEVDTMVEEFAKRREFLLAGLERLGLETPSPRGAFYAFPDVSAYLDERGSIGFCEDVLEQQDLAIVPGAAFGVDGHVRLSYALSMERLGEALERFEAFLASRAGTRV